MTTSAEQVTTASGQRTVGAARQVATTAPARCRAYALLSALTASPHDVEVPAVDVSALECLPFAADLDALCREFAVAGSARLKAEYSALFEVGSAGPPAPIREDLFTGQKAGTREDIVRFYDFFGYRLVDRFAWAPDHLSVELEFMHFLCYHEARDSADRLSCQLGQLDFAARHPAKWAPDLAEVVARVAPGAFYGRVIAAVRDFVAADLAWQLGTVSAGPSE